jgi:hypothetical protein
MAQNNAINASLPISPAHGGTGVASPTAHGIMIAEGSSNMTPLVLGAGQLAIGTTSGDPTAAAPTGVTNGGITVNATSGELSFQLSGTYVGTFAVANTASSTGVALEVSNSSNTSGSYSNLLLQTGGTSAGNAYASYTNTTTIWQAGMKSSDASFRISSNASGIGTGDAVILTSGNQQNMPLQSCFQVYLNSQASNVTGDGTVYTVAFASKVFDQNSDFNTGTFTFTAPVAGRYLFLGVISLAGTSAITTDTYFIDLVTTANTFALAQGLVGITGPSIPYSQIANMSASDTATITVKCTGGTKIVAVYGDSLKSTSFSGYLIC